LYKEKKLVEELILKYKTSSPFELCELEGVKLSFKPLGTLNGIYRYSKRNKFITVNIDREIGHQRFICGHELGHSIIHPNENRIFLNTTLFVPNKREIEASRFAVYLLVEYYGCYENIPWEYLKLIV